MINDKAILVGVDGSHASYKATWWAANYAKHAGLTLQIVCAYSLPSYAAVSFDATYTAMGDDNAAHNDAQEILSKAKAIAGEQGVEASTLIVTGDPASVFVELSRNYNLIVIGNRGKGGLPSACWAPPAPACRLMRIAPSSWCRIPTTKAT